MCLIFLDQTRDHRSHPLTFDQRGVGYFSMVEFMSSLTPSAPNLRPTQQSSIVDDGSSFAIVTPTYWRDLTRCELLVESLDRCAPSVPHYLIVDRRDRSTFAHLDRGQHRIIESESLLDED